MKKLQIEGFIFQTITQKEAINRIQSNKEVFILFEDGTEATAETETEVNTAVKNGLKLAYELTQVQQKETQEKKQAPEVKKANDFYTWFANLGGNLTHFNAENIIKSCSNTSLKFSSFKANPGETKQKHNHKFTFNL